MLARVVFLDVSICLICLLLTRLLKSCLPLEPKPGLMNTPYSPYSCRWLPFNSPRGGRPFLVSPLRLVALFPAFGVRARSVEVLCLLFSAFLFQLRNQSFPSYLHPPLLSLCWNSELSLLVSLSGPEPAPGLPFGTRTESVAPPAPYCFPCAISRRSLKPGQVRMCAWRLAFFQAENPNLFHQTNSRATRAHTRRHTLKLVVVWYRGACVS